MPKPEIMFSNSEQVVKEQEESEEED